MLIKLKIQKLRVAKGYSQETMANKLGISANSYRQIESGKTKLISQRVFEIASILQTTPEDILLGDTANEFSHENIEGIGKEYMEKIERINSENKIFAAELRGEIQKLKADLETKESIIGVLKESLSKYNK